MVQRVIAAEIDYMLSLLRPMRAMFGEAAGIATANFGGAVALSMQTNADPPFNRVLGFGEDGLPLLDEILDWYARRHTACRFDILFAAPSVSPLEALVERGFPPRPLETFLYASPPYHALIGESEPEVRALAGDDLEEFAAAFLAVYPQESSVEGSVRTCLKAQYDQPGWHCYLASVAGTVAAFGAMYVNDGTAALVSAATVPQFRNRGCQSALLARRMADAAELGCDLVWSHAACDSTSQHNMERLGMRPVAIKYRHERPTASF